MCEPFIDLMIIIIIIITQPLIFLPASRTVVPSFIWWRASVWVVWSRGPSAVVRGHAVVAGWGKERRIDVRCRRWSTWWGAWHVRRWRQGHRGPNGAWRTRREGSWGWWSLLRGWGTRGRSVTWRRGAWGQGTHWRLAELTREEYRGRRPVATIWWTSEGRGEALARRWWSWRARGTRRTWRGAWGTLHAT